MAKLILVGDVNLMGIEAGERPFACVAEEFRAADLVFANLECCLHRPSGERAIESEGFYADPEIAGEALKAAQIRAVGIANNVNYGAAAITASIARLDAVGIAHTGAGRGRAAARAPVVLEASGVRVGFVQRSSVYWPTDHEAGERSVGIATIRGHTAYRVPLHGGRPPYNRPGVPPEVVTWADPDYLAAFAEDVAALRRQADVVVASCHWGLGREVLQYMKQIGHAAIDAGADIVMGHGPHFSLPVETYKGRPIFYGLGSFSFRTGHHGRRHGDWLGMMVRVALDGTRLSDVTLQFVRHDEANETVPRTLAEEAAGFDEIARESSALGARLEPAGEVARVLLRA